MVDERSARFPLGRQVRLTELSKNPYPILRQLQVNEPVSWIPELGLWFVTRRADIEQILRDPDTFTVMSEASLLEDTFGPSMLSRDGDEHQRLRRPFQAPFLPRAVQASMTPAIEAYAHHLIDQFVPVGAVDLAVAFSDPLALHVVTHILGLPVHDVPAFRRWFTAIADALGNYIRNPEIRRRGRLAAATFGDYTSVHLERMAHEPDDSVLCAAVHAPEQLTEEELLAQARVIIFGGLETTAALFSNTVWALLNHPEQFAVVRSEPMLLKQAVEETLRWESPVQTCTRHVTRRVTWRGVTLEPGETVQCMVGAGNRDPAHYENPDEFNIWRENARDHLAFAIGKHFCLGAALARLEAEVGLWILFERLPGLRLDPEKPSRPHGHEFRSPPALHVRWDV